MLQGAEYPKDVLALKLLEYQMECNVEMKRGQSALGGHNVKRDREEQPVQLPAFWHWKSKEMAQHIKHNAPSLPSGVPASRSEFAQACLKGGKIHTAPFPGTWVVQNVSDQDTNMVTKNDAGKYSCSCKLAGKCYHVLAIQYHNKDSVDEKSVTYRLSNIEKKQDPMPDAVGENPASR